MDINNEHMALFLKEFFAVINDRQLVINPDAFFPIKKNGIFDSHTLTSFQQVARDKIKNCCLVYINNDEEVNARAILKNDLPVIAIYSGAVKKILYCANLMMLSEKFLPGVGNLDACYAEVTTEAFPIGLDEHDKVTLTMPVSGDVTRQLTGYMIAHLALCFLVFHEIGHHVEGHFDKWKDRFGLACNDAIVANEDELKSGVRKKLEFEADLYAISESITYMEYVMEPWSRIIGIDLTYTELIQLMIPALVLIKENFSYDAFLPDEIKLSYYLPNIIRLSFSAISLSMHQKTRGMVTKDLTALFNEDEQFKKIFERQNNIKVFDKNMKLTDRAFGGYFANMIVGTKQIYNDIFVGSSYPIAFTADSIALDWYDNMYE